MCIVRFYNFGHKFYIFVCILLLKLSFIQQNKRFAVGTDASSFRFQDFEPRVLSFHYSNVTFKPRSSIELHSRNFDEPRHRNETRKHDQNAEYSHLERESRGFHFYSTNEDTTVDVEFVIPFMRIPIEHGMHLTKSTMRSLMNLKTGSVLWTGALVAVGALIAGGFNSIGALMSAFLPINSHKKRMRNVNKRGFDIFDNFIESLSSTAEGSIDFGNIINEKLLQYNIDLSACMQKTICSYVEKAGDDVRSGKASGIQKILDGIATTQLLPQYFSGTAIQIAIEAAQKSSCHKWRKLCRLSKFENSHFVNSFLKYLKND